MKKITVTIGIPAYNEESNIGFLIEDLLKQNTSEFVLEKILVVSDGSTDKTAEIVMQHKNEKIILVENTVRKGLAKTQNEILQISESDILVLLNADLMIEDPRYIYELINPIKNDRAELTCSFLEELEQFTITGDILNVSMKFKTSVFEKLNKGDNVYTCHAARAFSKKLYKQFIFKGSIGEDAYSYLFAKFNKYRYEYVKSTKAYYRLPSNYKDHERQSIRFIQSKKKFIREFGEKFVSDNYSLPLELLINTSIKFALKYPIHMFLYVLIYLGIKVKAIFAANINDNWEISISSKALRIKIL